MVVRPDDINAEAHGNMWSFSLTAEQAASVTTTDVVAFAAAVADARRAWLSANGFGSLVLYWWHDSMAGQLRFSMVSAKHGQLPFRCEIFQTSSLEPIASDWLGSASLHGIPWNELRESAPAEAAAEPPHFVLPVWSVALDQSNTQPT